MNVPAEPSLRPSRALTVQLQQVLLNPIINAIEAMSGIKERSGELTIVYGVPCFVAGQRTGAVDTRGGLV